MAVHLEEIIEQIGGCGRYQVILSLFIHLTKTITCFSMVFMVFGGASPDWWCVDEMKLRNDSLLNMTVDSRAYKLCEIANGTGTCQNFIFGDSINSVINEADNYKYTRDEVVDGTVLPLYNGPLNNDSLLTTTVYTVFRTAAFQIRWSLVCGNSWVASTITSIQMAGVLVGNFVCGHAADLIGRKFPLYGGVLGMTVLNCIAIFSTSWIMFAVIRFFLGIGMAFQLTTMYSYQSEFTLARWRTWVVAVPSWAIQLAIFALVAWLCKDWRYIHAVTAATGLPLMATCWFVPESFRWRVAHDKTKEANDIVRFVAKVNRKPAPDMHQLQELVESVKKESAEQTDRKYSIIDILRNKDLLVTTLLLVIVWVSLGLGGYGIQFGVPSLSGNLYLNIFVLAALGSPLQFLNVYLQNRIGRKKASIFFFLVFTATSAFVGIGHRFKESKTLNTAMSYSALTSLTAINAAWSPVQTLTIEMYPTVVRNIGYGTLSTMARVGAVIGPQLVYLLENYGSRFEQMAAGCWPGVKQIATIGTFCFVLDSKVSGLMYIICAIVGIISIMTILPLRETKDDCMQDRLQEYTSSASTEEEADSRTLDVKAMA